jgi:hypothetical protein
MSSIKGDVKKIVLPRPEERCFLEIQHTAIKLPGRSVTCDPRTLFASRSHELRLTLGFTRARSAQLLSDTLAVAATDPSLPTLLRWQSWAPSTRNAALQRESRMAVLGGGFFELS